MFQDKLLLPLAQTLYLWVLGVTIGAIIALGVFGAPVIFKAWFYLPDLPLTKFHSGILMTQIFVKFGYLLNFTAFFIIAYEILAFKLGVSRPPFLLFGGLSVIGIFLFTLYYTPYIIEAQKLGEEATGSSAFASMHIQSEWVFKLLLLTLSLLFFSRILNLLGRK